MTHGTCASSFRKQHTVSCRSRGNSSASTTNSSSADAAVTLVRRRSKAILSAISKGEGSVMESNPARRWWQMVGHGAKFGRKKEEAIIALLSHPNIEAVARAAEHVRTHHFENVSGPEDPMMPALLAVVASASAPEGLSQTLEVSQQLQEAVYSVLLVAGFRPFRGGIRPHRAPEELSGHR